MDHRSYAIEFGKRLKAVLDARKEYAALKGADVGRRMKALDMATCAEQLLGALVADQLSELAAQPSVSSCNVSIERYLTSGCEDTMPYGEWRQEMEKGRCCE